MRVTSGLLLVTTSRNPGVWGVKTVWARPPHQRSDQEVDGGDRRPPPELQLALLQPLGMLVEHGVDDVHEGLVGRKEAMAPGQHITLKPSFESVLAQHLHHPPV